MTQDRFKWIVKCLDFDRLSDWESRFIEDLERRMKVWGDLTERQEEILERIQREKGT